jgi:hypothetical protein
MAENLQRIPAGANIDNVIRIAQENKAKKLRNEAEEHGVDLAEANKRMEQARNLFEMFMDKKGINMDDMTSEQAQEIAREIVDLQELGDFDDSSVGNKKIVEKLIGRIDDPGDRERANV